MIAAEATRMRLSTIIERGRVCIMILVLVTGERMNDLGYELCSGEGLGRFMFLSIYFFA
jgi:hypothetical protein